MEVMSNKDRCQHRRRAWLTEYEPDTGSWGEYYGCPDCGEELPRPLTIIDHLRRLWWKVETALGINTIPF
jgi:hypothetical protein